MYETNRLAGSVAESLMIAHETISPYWAGSLPSGPFSAVTTPVFSASHSGFSRHCSQLGSASLRSPASSSRMNDDQMVMAALPEKYVARVESTSWLPLTECFWARLV